MGAGHTRTLSLTMVLVALLGCSESRAAWFDAAWPFRRAIDVTWDFQKNTGAQLGIAEFYASGHVKPNGADVRIADEEGKVIASHVLGIGPGDKVRVVFALVQPVRRYYAYFGNENPPAPKPAVADVKYDAGLWMQMRELPNLPLGNAEQLKTAWEKADKPIGETMIDQPFIGYNPFGPQERTIAKYTGVLRILEGGEYLFSTGADDFGAIYLDGEALLYAAGPGDSRVRKTLHLAQGPHAFVYYHANVGGEGRFSVVWSPTGQKALQLIGPTPFGLINTSRVGPLEENHKILVADCEVQYVGESFFANGYAHEFHFTACEPKTARAQYEWDFGDGQTGVGTTLEHVYLADGIYPLTLTARIGANKDTQTIRIPVSRDWENITHVTLEAPTLMSRVLTFYKVDKIPEAQLARAVFLHERAQNIDPMLAVAARLASLPKHANALEAMTALREATHTALAKGRADTVLSIWEHVPAGSDLQPEAARQYAQLLMWRTGDFGAAVKILKPYAASGDEKFKRIYGDALLLAQHADEARAILEKLPMAAIGERRVAISGAMARNIEFFITEKDFESGEDAWEDWQQKFPADFLEGYSAVLKVRLLELNSANEAAAKVAEAFALAVPTSAYSPQLLDRASKLLAQSNPNKSATLHQLLKDKYPEDPLAQ